MSGKIPARRRALIKAAVKATSKGDKFRHLVGLYYRGVDEADLERYTAGQLSARALSHYQHADSRRRGQALVRVFNPSQRSDHFESTATLVQIAVEDMPFLVDSIGMVFSRLRIGVHLLVHPVLNVARTANGRIIGIGEPGQGAGRDESWQLLEIDKQTDAASIRRIELALREALADVMAAVRDWRTMRKRAQQLAATLEQPGGPVAAAERHEAAALLKWMDAGHFVFLGYRYYRLHRGRGADRLIPDKTSGLGILRTTRARRRKPVELRGEARRRAREQAALVITKANSVATVHRATYLDHVGVKAFDRSGRAIGEHRLLGLWTSGAYLSSPRDIPVLRAKVARVLEEFALEPSSHDAKAVSHLIETYPRDELFQASVADLTRIVRSAVNLYERRKVRLLVRRDPYDRFFSCMVYVPRDRYNTQVRQRIEQLLREAYRGRALESQVQISDSNHARLHIVVRTEPGERVRPDLDRLEEAITAAATTWNDRLREALHAAMPADAAAALAARYENTFPIAYQDELEPAAAIDDITELQALGPDSRALRLVLHRPVEQLRQRAHLKIIKRGEPIPISDLLPTMENFSLRVIAERPYQLEWPDGGTAWIQDFEFEDHDGAAVDIARIEDRFVEGFLAVWRGEVENDGFNRLLLRASLTIRQIAMLRSYGRYLLQTGIPFSQNSMERALAAHPRLAQTLWQLFALRLDPESASRTSLRQEQRMLERSNALLDDVTSLDDDRMLRSFRDCILATLRSNFFQRDKDGVNKSNIALKLDPTRIPGLPLPLPMYEIFVYSPRVEGVHLRKGPVARGGLRWSDRREDFRTEVLGLMKAQNVKNTVIVPAGAKGGFVPKQMPAGANRDEVQREGIACYSIFIRSLLDVTDNIVDGRVVHPSAVRCRDGDDPYLVVAADKGTATFSDIANAIAAEYGFWLGDAFASGGSAGYDHKKMAITARGAWESVKRHFRELGVDTQKDEFTVLGIGDMSGDVFGNGMLLSDRIRLLAAFNHQHIFIDPAPVAARSFAERQRLFALPRSGWDDYDRRAISRGGGIFQRSAKTVALSNEIRAMLGIEAAALSPNELIRALLQMPVDLLWNGGIGTYIKASTETHAQIGDRSNDGLRVDARKVRARVIGEGGNLGVSQLGRVEFSARGGRINTDFIDNSGGVNSSDLEVNIKILLNDAERSTQLTRPRRNQLLRQMTNEVAALVLRNNYLQSQTLSVLELNAGNRLQEHRQLIRSLERVAELNREVEFLPSDEEIAERGKRGERLTRPELAVLLSYSKILLKSQLTGSDVANDPYLSGELPRYFPTALARRYAKQMQRHRLRREIIVTATTNSLINRMGPSFVIRAGDDTGAPPVAVARAYAIARESFAMRDVWAAIEALDNRVAAATQYSMHWATSRALRHVTYWLLAHRRGASDVESVVREYQPAIAGLARNVESYLAGEDLSRFHAMRDELIGAGTPAGLANHVASLAPLEAAFDLVEINRRARQDLRSVAALHFAIGANLGIDWLQNQIDRLRVDGPWQARARNELRERAARTHRDFTRNLLATRKGPVADRIGLWRKPRESAVADWLQVISEMRAVGGSDFATLSVGVESLRKLLRA
ncbi:MAG: NAD-glutamate dehydrogenase [Steroidobacteraceae bacterium]